MARSVHYFAVGSLQTGFPNHAEFAGDLGETLGRYRTVDAYPLVVPASPVCSNPGCRFVHRMCALLPETGAGMPVEGELFAVDASTIDKLDRLENYMPHDETRSTYLRRTVRVTPLDSPGEAVDAEVYFMADAASWHRLLDRGEAEILARYTSDLAVGTLKDCCRRNPGHEGPHDLIALVNE